MRRLLLILALLLAAPRLVLATDPAVPSGKDPGGVAVAMLTTGLDYTVPEIARGLARDGEGEIIGWDFADGDQRPYVAGGDADGDVLARALFAAGGVRLVPLRVSLADPASLARALAFIARTPARIVVLTLESGSEAEWAGFRAAADHFQELLIVTASIDGRAYPAQIALANQLVVASRPEGRADLIIEGATSVEAAQRVIAQLRCLDLSGEARGAALKDAALTWLSGLGSRAKDGGLTACPEERGREQKR